MSRHCSLFGADASLVAHVPEKGELVPPLSPPQRLRPLSAPRARTVSSRRGVGVDPQGNLAGGVGTQLGCAEGPRRDDRGLARMNGVQTPMKPAVVVTGASSGIGHALSLVAARDGAPMVLIGTSQ